MSSNRMRIDATRWQWSSGGCGEADWTEGHSTEEEAKQKHCRGADSTASPAGSMSRRTSSTARRATRKTGGPQGRSGSTAWRAVGRIMLGRRDKLEQERAVATRRRLKTPNRSAGRNHNKRGQETIRRSAEGRCMNSDELLHVSLEMKRSELERNLDVSWKELFHSDLEELLDLGSAGSFGALRGDCANVANAGKRRTWVRRGVKGATCVRTLGKLGTWGKFFASSGCLRPSPEPETCDCKERGLGRDRARRAKRSAGESPRSIASRTSLRRPRIAKKISERNKHDSRIGGNSWAGTPRRS